MLGVALVAASVCAVAGQLEVAPKIVSETRAGEAPVIAGGAPEAGFVQVLTPGVSLDYPGHRFEVRANYELRMFWRTVSGSVPAPLLLNTLEVSVGGYATRRLQLSFLASAYEGQVDYTYLQSVFGASQASVVTVPKLISATATALAQFRATRLVTPEISFQFSHNQPIGQAPPTAPQGNFFTLPNFTSLAANPAVNVRTSRVDDLTTSAAVEYQRVSDLTINGFLPAAGVEMPPTHALSALIVIPAVSWRRKFPLESALTLKLGVALTHLDVDYPETPGATYPGQQDRTGGKSDAVTPVGSATFNGRLLSTRRAVLLAKLAASLDYFLDPVLGIPAPHATTTGTLTLGLPHDWTIGLQGAFTTSLEAHPLITPTGPYYPNEVAASVTVPVRHLLTDHVLLELGAQWADRWTFFTAPPQPPPYNQSQRQLWLYVSLAATTHRTRPPTVVTAQQGQDVPLTLSTFP